MDPSENWDYDYYSTFVPRFLAEYALNEQLLTKFLLLTNSVQTQCQALIAQFPPDFTIKSQVNFNQGLKRKICAYSDQNKEACQQLRLELLKTALNRYQIEVTLESAKNVDSLIDKEKQIRKSVKAAEDLVEEEKLKLGNPFNPKSFESELKGILSQAQAKVRVQSAQKQLADLRAKVAPMQEQAYEARKIWNQRIKAVVEKAVEWPEERFPMEDQQFNHGLELVSEGQLQSVLDKIDQCRSRPQSYQVSPSEAQDILADFIKAHTDLNNQTRNDS